MGSVFCEDQHPEREERGLEVALHSGLSRRFLCGSSPAKLWDLTKPWSSGDLELGCAIPLLQAHPIQTPAPHNPQSRLILGAPRQGLFGRSGRGGEVSSIFPQQNPTVEPAVADLRALAGTQGVLSSCHPFKLRKRFILFL